MALRGRWLIALLASAPLWAMTGGWAQGAAPDFSFELWGRASYGDGYVYGPSLQASGLTVVDFDLDGDNDFVMPTFTQDAPLLMRNLGNAQAFYPGGPRDLKMTTPDTFVYDRFMDFADVTGEGRPDAVVVISSRVENTTRIVLYENQGPAHDPVFTLTQTIHVGPGGPFTIGPVNLADIDGDGLLDLFFIEWVMSDPVRSHRLFYMAHTGTPASPAWAPAGEWTNLSSLMPPRFEADLKRGDSAFSPWRDPSIQAARHEKTVYDPRVYDIQMADWDIDGDLDFMFYDSESGVDWVLNLGTPQAPVFDTVVNRYLKPWPGAPTPDFARVFGSFAVAPAPFAPDFYVTYRGRLEGWRFDPVQSIYTLLQQSAVAFEMGIGQPAFWDYDGDGDLDIVRGAPFFSTNQTPLFVVANTGTPYMPVWGGFVQVYGPTISLGSAANGYRQDQYQFVDADYDGLLEFFHQKQDGRVSYYETVQSLSPGTQPSIYLMMDNVANIVAAGHTGVQPRGLALADYGAAADGHHQLIAVYASDQGGQIVFSSRTAAAPWNLFLWPDAVDITAVFRDETGAIVAPNTIESIAPADLNQDGRPDLVVVREEVSPYRSLTYHYYENRLLEDQVNYTFAHAGMIPAPVEAGSFGGRLIGFADIDADTDADLFVGHQRYNPDITNTEFNRFPYLHFYRNQSDVGLNFYQTRVVSGQSWLFYIGDVLPNYAHILNLSNGTINGGQYVAGPYSHVVDIIQTVNHEPPWRVFIDVLPPVGAESKAIVAVGSAPDDPLYNTFLFLGKTAAETLELQGLAPENIRLYAPSEPLGAATLAKLETSVTQWAADAQRLLVYLVDHGQKDRFRLNDMEYLEASVYAQWANTLQTANPDLVLTTVIDTCEAGTFVDDLALSKEAKATGAQRITITGSNIGPTEGLALFDSVRGLSFSLAFWEEIRTGGSYGRAFSNARVAIQSINPLQTPVMDGNGNGVGNEPNDGFLASQSRPGADFEQPATGVFIGEVAPNQAVNANEAVIWLSDVVTNFPVEQAGALIVPPNLLRETANGDDEQPITGLQWVDLEYNEDLSRWEKNVAVFTKGGLYRIQYYVNALGRYYASPRIGFVDRIGAPDAWEDDDSAQRARWIAVNQVQGHNFHDAGDTDWIRFASAPGLSATLAIVSAGERCRPLVELYQGAQVDANLAATPLDTVESPGFGQAVTFNRTFSTAEEYLLRIRNGEAGVFGAGTSYLVVIATDTGNLVLPTLLVNVFEQGKNIPVAAAAIEVSGQGLTQYGATTFEGKAQFTLTEDGNYTVRVERPGFDGGLAAKPVNNQLEEVSVYLTRQAGNADVNNSGAVNAVDVQLTINGALDVPVEFTTDIDKNGVTNAVDVQLVILAALA